MNFKLVDAHAHINSEFYKDDWRAVLERALNNGIAVVNVGTNKKDSEENVKIAEEMKEGVYATVGLHPTEEESFDYNFYKKLAGNGRVVAIGECGLDYYRIPNNESKILEKKRQEGIFREQIRLAGEVGKPLMLHLRTEEAYEDAIEMLDETIHGTLGDFQKIVFHFYSGTKEQTERLLAWENFYVTVGGVITFVRDYDEVLKMIPIERMMVETDSPFVTPEPYRSQLRRADGRGARNEPAYIVETVKKLAEIKGVSEEEAARVTTETARRVLGLI